MTEEEKKSPEHLSTEKESHGFVAKTSWFQKIKEFNFHSFFATASYGRTLALIAILIIVVALPVTMIVLQQKTNIQQHASYTCSGAGGICVDALKTHGQCPSNYKPNDNLDGSCTGYNDNGMCCVPPPTPTPVPFKNTCTSTSGNKCAPANQGCNYFGSYVETSGTCDIYHRQACCKPAPPTPTPNTACKSSSGVAGKCYTNNSCGAGMHEIDTYKGQSCPTGYRICCAAGAPDPWYDCGTTNGQLGGTIVKHTTTSTTTVARCSTDTACQDPSTGLVIIKDSSTAVDQAKTALCKLPGLTKEVRACLVNKYCGTAGNLMTRMVLEYNKGYAAVCRVVWSAAVGGVPFIGPGIVDAICSNLSNLVAIITLVPTIEANTICQNNMNAAADATDLAGKVVGSCPTICSAMLKINPSKIPPIASPVLYMVNPIFSSSGTRLCQLICPHISTDGLQSVLSVCLPQAKITVAPEQKEEEIAKGIEDSIPQCVSKQQGVCENSCGSGRTSAGNKYGCTTNYCCVPSGSNNGGGNNGGGGGNSCTNGKATKFAMNIKLPGIGSAKFENDSPKHDTKHASIVIKDDTGKVLQGSSHDWSHALKHANGNGKLGLGRAATPQFVCGKKYYVEVKIPGYVTIKKQITYGDVNQTIEVSENDIIPGDIVSAGTDNFITPDNQVVGDDQVTIADYNIYRACHEDPTKPIEFKNGDKTYTLNCSDLINLFDFSDGGITGTDANGISEFADNYNLWFRGYLRFNKK